MLTKDQVVCLRTVAYSETSQIVTLFGRSTGKFDAIAKGSRRAKSAFEGPIEVFAFGQAVFSPRSQGLATLTELQQAPRFVGLRRRFHGLQCGLCGVELLDALTEPYDPDPALFDQGVAFLEDLQTFTDEADDLRRLIVFQWGLLQAIGGGLVLTHCANCRAPYTGHWPRAYFSSTAQGLVCPDCEPAFVDRLALDRSSVACLTEPRRLKEAAEPTLRRIETLLLEHFSNLLHRRPRTAAFFLGGRDGQRT
ncbi:MAG TPA: DNA repair protein RecO [Phycisphaerales bacterium]|nr:DNA repair protein RecO [Phycisphaerales bacterium]